MLPILFVIGLLGVWLRCVVSVCWVFHSCLNGRCDGGRVAARDGDSLSVEGVIYRYFGEGSWLVFGLPWLTSIGKDERFLRVSKW